jgi:glycosyltransferase involved in cell wall biosynthesis
MIILVYSTYNSENVRGNLGKSEYSYYFVLREFRPILEKLGIVVEVHDPLVDVDIIYRNCVARNVPCVFLAFMPPNKVPIGLSCPTVPVFAWEYETLPNESFSGKPRNDWRRVLTHLGSAITHSSYTAKMVKEALGEEFPIVSAPSPLWDRLSVRFNPSAEPFLNGMRMHVDGMVIDSRITDLAPYSKAAEREIAPIPLPLPPERLEGRVALDLNGVVYTSIFNPGDGRKNWKNMISAFCIAFTDVEDATLLLKLSHHDVSEILPQMLVCLHKAGKFACRVVLINGYLQEADYEHMVDATNFTVNTSHGEGQCLPLMEYMSCGKPAIAPRHTAMLDYVNESCAFVIDSSSVIGTWPHDMRQAFRTLRKRIHFGSLVKAYKTSYYVAKNDPDTYKNMAAAAVESLRGYCSKSVVKNRLEQFLNSVIDMNARKAPAGLRE